MSEENISQEFRLKSIDEKRNYLIEEINQNELITKKHKKVYRILNYIEHLFTLISKLTGCVSNFCFFYRNYEFCNRINYLCSNCRN